MDKSNYIKSLLEKYWAGESSVDEENAIFAYYGQGDVADELIEYAPIFSYLDTEKDIKIDLTDQIMGKIENLQLESDEIKTVLEKYWLGESSLDEEKKIYSYYEKENIHADLKQYAPIFSYLSSERKRSLDVTEAVMQKINTAKPVTKVIPINWGRVISIAASFLLILSVGFFTYQGQTEKRRIEAMTMDTFESPEEALEQTKAALAYLSARMNKGTDKAAKSLNKTESLQLFNQ